MNVAACLFLLVCLSGPFVAIGSCVTRGASGVPAAPRGNDPSDAAVKTADAAPPTPADPATTAPFAPLRDRTLDELLADDPSTARDLGLHEYDGKVSSVSKTAIRARIARLRASAAELAAVDAATLSIDDALDLAELKSWVAQSLFTLVDSDAPSKHASFYENLFDVSCYIDRAYAPLEARAEKLTAQEEAALAEVAHVRENLRPPLSKPTTEVAARNFEGFTSYLRGDVVRIMSHAGDDAQRRRFAAANEALAKAAADLASWLAKEAARGDQSHILGPTRYAKLLRVQEGLTMPLDDFERMNEVDLAENKRAYEELSARVKPKPVKEAELFATAAQMMRRTRQFVADHAIVTLPSTDVPIVRETPAYERWNSASIEMSGPFETARSAFYQLTIPDKSWPEKERAAYFGSLGDLLGTTIHEVYPGHFVQGRDDERAPTRVQKAFSNYSFVEGWAHYAEWMMIEQGFGSDDEANRLAMLHGALLRNCRFYASMAIHAKGMTVEDVEKRFMTDCHQDAASAHEQAVRGTFDPGYFAYTLGKLQIIALRREAEAKAGPRFSLQRFHDALLAHGAPPLALVHDIVLREAAP